MILLRKAKEEDLPVIQAIGTETYYPTYEHLIGRPQVEYMLGKFYSLAALRAQLIAGHTFLIAKEGTRNLGFASYAMLNPSEMKLHKLYVLPQAHGRGVGKLLINEVYQKARDAGAAFLLLNVNRYNKAKDFYEKAGFKIRETVDLDLGDGFLANDYIMELPLQP